MAEAIGIRISNIADIKAAFNRSPGLMRRELNTAIKKTVFKVQAASMTNTPVLTGRLRASTRSLFGDLRGEVGTNTNYDVYVHEGTRYMQARPYLRMAVEDNAHNIDNYFTEAVDKVLNEIGKAT